jgi:hypothetical protein
LFLQFAVDSDWNSVNECAGLLPSWFESSSCHLPGLRL